MAGRSRGRLRVGTSGYHYAHWRSVFYPHSLPRQEWLAHYARHFDSVEINNTFYRLPEERTFDAWRQQVPPDFRFALKLSRFATHVRRLREPESALAHFLERAERLGARLGPILAQLPPHWRPELGRLDDLLAAVPRARRFAVEIRDPRWLGEPLFAVLRRRGAALCIHDGLDRHPREVTADWVYLRFHGPSSGEGYSAQALSGQARRIRRWLASGLDVYAYFNNDARGHAVRNARDLCRFAGGD